MKVIASRFMWKQDMFELLVTHIKNGNDEVDILEKL